MTSDRPSWQDINAYVDGELPPQAMAEVAEAAARDHRIGREIAALARLKAALHEGRESVDPARLLPRRRGGGALRRCILPGAIAACLVVVAAAGYLLMETQRPPAALATATDAHRDWLTALETGSAGGADTLRPARLEALDPALFVPDLSDSGLRFSGLRQLAGADEGSGLHVGYLGPNGCTVSLLILPGPAGLASERRVIQGDFGTAHLWRAGDRAVVVLSATMAPGRLASVAAAIEAAMRERQPLDRQGHETLQASRASNPPCLA